MLTLVRAPKDNGSHHSDEGYAVFDGDRCVGHIMRAQQAPQGKPWFWTIFARELQGKNDRGYAATRGRAMAEFKAGWEQLRIT